MTKRQRDKTMPLYIIEHLEPRLWRWCLIEYKHISQLVGKQNLWFTNIKKESKELEKYGKVFSKSVKEMNLPAVCILDPDAPQLLTPKDAVKFQYFIFGGILGDYPPKKRTKAELSSQFSGPIETRNIGTMQMSTDNAVAVVQQILQGKRFEQLRFQDEIEIPIEEGESIMFPYRYLLVDGKPLVSRELVEYLKRKKGF